MWVFAFSNWFEIPTTLSRQSDVEDQTTGNVRVPGGILLNQNLFKTYGSEQSVSPLRTDGSSSITSTRISMFSCHGHHLPSN